jgi:hypothetical protein
MKWTKWKWIVPMVLVLASGLVPITSSTAGAGVPGCPPAKEYSYTKPTNFTFRGPLIGHLWWNNGVPPWGQKEIRTKLRSGRVTYLDAMGTVWKYKNIPSCRQNLQAEFNKAPNMKAVSLRRLINLGLAKQS